ncbi:hypothetical protein PR048_030246, partial [Dryococelus australis]
MRGCYQEEGIDLEEAYSSPMLNSGPSFLEWDSPELPKTVEELLKDFNMSEVKLVSTPAVGTKMEGKNNINKSFPYREFLGRLLYLLNKTRPDITYAVNMCSRKTERPTNVDVVFTKPISWYIRKQPVLALSTAEVEYIAPAECIKELMYLKIVVKETLGQEGGDKI